MSYSETISAQHFYLTIVNDSENKIKSQAVVVTIFDDYLYIKFKKYRNKKLKYGSIHRWITNKDGTKVSIEYLSRKDDNCRLLTFLSDDGSAEELGDRLLEHCQFIADMNKKKKRKE